MSARRQQRQSFGGKTLEDVIRCLKLKRFTIITHADFIKRRRDLLSKDTDRWLVKNLPYTTIYGTPGRREYFVETEEWSGQLECKYQNVGGSVDEKMVYVTETLRRTDVKSLMLVYAGQYWSRGRGAAIIRWLYDEQINLAREGKCLAVATLDEFIDWANATWD